MIVPEIKVTTSATVVVTSANQKKETRQPESCPKNK